MARKTIEHYEILRRLGAGGSGVVYLANDTLLQRPVVLKILRAGALSVEQMRTTVLREARLADADAYVTATDGDNTNIVSAQLVREHFGVPCCVARVYDPLRADLFEQTGIRTVCPTKDAQALLHEAIGSCKLGG